MTQTYLTIGAAAKFLDVHPNTLRNWDKSGKFSPHHVSESGYKYYSQEQLKNFLKQYSKFPEIDTSLASKDLGAKFTITPERQSKGIVAKYHYFATSKPVRYLKNICLNESVTIQMGKFGSVDFAMWLDEKMQKKLNLPSSDVPEDELHSTEQDLFIIESIISLKKAGNKEFTAAQLVKHMHGNTSGGISDAEIKEVEDRIRTMMTWTIQITVSDDFRRIYRNLPKKIQGHLLDTVILERKDNSKTRMSCGLPINGSFGIPDDKDVAIILETFAESLRQLTCFPTSLLNIDMTRQRRDIRILTNCLVKKIQGLKANRRGIDTLLFSTFEENFGMSDYSPNKRSRFRQCMIKIVQSCKDKGMIKNFEVIMDGRHFHSIKFEWNKEQKQQNVRNGLKRGNKVHSR